MRLDWRLLSTCVLGLAVAFSGVATGAPGSEAEGAVAASPESEVEGAGASGSEAEGAVAGTPPAPPGPVYEETVTSARDLVEDVVTTRHVDEEDIRQESARTLDEALVRQPGLVIRTGADGVPRIDMRGLRTRHVRLLVDGIPTLSSYDGQFDPR
jgi:outer membrane cobalamin receptor